MAPDQLRRPKVSVCYVREDLQQVARLVDDLQKAGVDVWWDKRIPGGVRWKDKIRQHIRDGNFFVACFSDEYWARSATYMNEELIVACEELRLRRRDTAWFIPVRLSDCQIPENVIGAGETLRDLQRVDLWQDWDEGIRRILDVAAPDGPVPDEVRAELIRLDSEDPGTRAAAALALGGLNHAAAVPALRQSLHDAEATVRLRAVGALDNIDDLRADVAPALVRCLFDEDPDVRFLATSMLGDIGPGAASAVPALVECLHDRGYQTAELAAWVLGRIGDAAVPAVAPLIEWLCREGAAGRAAQRALDAIRTIGEAAVPPLTKCLQHEERQVRMEAACALGDIFGPPAEAAPALIECLHDTDDERREQAAWLLGGIGDPGEAGISELTELLEDDCPHVRNTAREALADIERGPDG